jgi:hypothetical protein
MARKKTKNWREKERKFGGKKNKTNFFVVVAAIFSFCRTVTTHSIKLS